MDGLPSPARLLVFQSSPQLYQSAVVLDKAGKNPILPSHAFALSIVTLLEQHGSLTKDNSCRYEEKEQLRVAVLGCGGGAVPKAIAASFPFCQINVVDLSPEVIYAAVNFFGMAVGSQIKVICQCGVSFLKDAASAVENEIDIISNRSESSKKSKTSFPTSFGCDWKRMNRHVHSRHRYNLIILDIAAENAIDNAPLELPPASVVKMTTLYAAYSVLEPGGSCLCNVIANRKMMKIVTDRYLEVFDKVMILAINPNLLFWGYKKKNDLKDTEGVQTNIPYSLSGCAFADLCEELDIYAPEIISPILRRTEEFKQGKSLLGWITPEHVKNACDDDSFDVHL